MTNSEFDELLSHIQSAEREVRLAGQAEYAHTDDNVFANFESAAKDLGGTRIDDLMGSHLQEIRMDAVARA